MNRTRQFVVAIIAVVVLIGGGIWLLTVNHRTPPQQSDSRVAQFWDHDHLVAKLMAKDATDSGIDWSCCEHDRILWDIAAVYSHRLEVVESLAASNRLQWSRRQCAAENSRRHLVRLAC